jgi:hypothetical protein
MAPRLLAAFGSQREPYRNADEVQSFSGIAPLTETSGKRKWVHFRWACPKFLRQSFHEWAGHSIAQSVGDTRAAMVNLNGRRAKFSSWGSTRERRIERRPEAGNGGYSQRTPTVDRGLLYSEEHPAFTANC